MLGTKLDTTILIDGKVKGKIKRYERLDSVLCQKFFYYSLISKIL